MIESKLPSVGTTIFTQISKLAQDHGAINLGQGFPDYDGPEALRKRVCDYINQGFNQYPPMTGVPKLREQVAAKVAAIYGRNVCPDSEVTIMPGATEGIYCAVTACVRPGDEVIVFDPAYDSYVPAIELSGGKAIRIPLLPPDFGLDWQRIKDAVSNKTRMIILNSPHNPTGMIWDAEDISQLKEIVRNTDILLLSDEVYEHLVFDGERHESLLLHEELAARAFVVSSFGKTFHVTGWKTGYCIAPAKLSAELRKVHQFVTFVGVNPIQMALADFMESQPDFCLGLSAFYQEKRDLFAQALKDSRFRFSPAAGTYFQLVDYSEISNRNDVAMAQWLTTEVGVAAIPISVFYQEPPSQHFVRFCFAKENHTLLAAAERLCQL